ncbi:MAG: hypothetical protein OXD54_02730 [Candidatus Poribacteria bacterium]|nr:hypothetical protein [Candidatus Poribacteria bacterium]
MNKYSGGNFDDFLKDEGIFEEVTDRTHKRLLILEIENIVSAANRNRTDLFQKMNTDLVQLNPYIFDLDNTIITSDLLKIYVLEAKEMKTYPVQFNDSLLKSEELLNRLLTEDLAA